MITEFVADARSRGLKFEYHGGESKQLIVSPRTKLTETDVVFIRENKQGIIHVLAGEVIKQLEKRECCPGICFGAESLLCAGCPQEEYRDANGLIYSAWCRDGNDVGEPVEVRERGTNIWKPIKKEA